ncbi:hypothetical protein BBF96_02500 [Anoxybacter fermentans]|uniref:Uncharacterized protein n=1 Tax=Anoxybacter fermentans TaxID=1323375 RepID=A0A3S9T2M4_9FIRM|nr:DUF494 family protein [Anoxybacter fermentans]AZR74798.1 hypothetical protein BBF96_02500 [Anoxybacter fermentans]
MNSNVLEIVTILVKKLLHNEDLINNEEEIIKGLLELGYNLNDIEMAFELIFSSTEIIGVSESFENHNYLPTSQRIFSIRERFIFSSEVQNVLLILLREKFLTLAILEEIIHKGFNLFFNVGIKELWYLLRITIDDEILLTRIKNRISSFKELKDAGNFFVQ